MIMGSNPVTDFRLVFEKGLRWPIIWVAMLCVIVGCADEVSEPEYIVSPYTEQTIAFFERSSSDDCPNVLETVQIDGNRCILKKQTQPHKICPDKYTLEAVPEKLLSDIVFNKLVMESTAQFDPAVLGKILIAFGTIDATRLELTNLVFNGSSSDNDEHPQTQRPIASICMLNVKELRLFGLSKSVIVWIQGQVVLSGSRMGLAIYCKEDFGDLEVLDWFDAASIARLALCDIDKLDSMECKLLEEGPFPNELVIYGDIPTGPDVSEEIKQILRRKIWKVLTIPMFVWNILVKTFEEGVHPVITTTLVIYLSPGVRMPSLVLKLHQVGANDLIINFHHTKETVTHQDITKVLDWVSRSFIGLRSLSIETKPGAIDGTDLAANNQFEIINIPATSTFLVNEILCRVAYIRTQPLITNPN
ncbi:hypothetical protein NEDG_02219 [Nematocida displodere]|uniref:Uncharacterized protein n=1 Tax=Nematocida displodere TaxID=1805483 RepID=A0A177EFV8_9MICR|nr:hypothetical protein NEDG_02219 [Nematocida displodere]